MTLALEATLHPEDPNSPDHRRPTAVDTDGGEALHWAYDTPVSAPRRGLSAPPAPAAALPEQLIEEAAVQEGTISPLWVARRETPTDEVPFPEAKGYTPPEHAAAGDRLEHLGLAVFLVGTGSLALAGIAAIGAVILLLL